MSPNELLISLLSDAYATEMKVIHTLEQHAVALDRYPDLREAIEKHLQQSRSHASMLERCVKRLNGEISALKVAVGEAHAFLLKAEGSAATDSLLHNLMNDYSAEHFEMAVYNVLIAVAQELGDSETADICRQILAEEVEMARFLNDVLPSITQDFVQSLGQ
jgi:ferritin-like metal-binding protein YciE